VTRFFPALSTTRGYFMPDPYINASLCFRFLNLDKLQAFTLTREVKGAIYTKHIDENYYVGSVPLLEEHLDNLNIFYVRQQINLNDCDIFIVVKSENTSGTFITPHIVNKLLKHIDCKLTFTFTLNDASVITNHGHKSKIVVT
jgi:hypothetical protein